MLLHELLVIVSGYPSSIDHKEFQHPSEREIFQRAIEFSVCVAYISSTLFKSSGPITPIIREVMEKYLQVVVDLEDKISEIDYSTVCAVTIDQHMRLLEYCSDLLRCSRNFPVALAVQLRQDVFSGFPQISEVAHRCLAAVDAYYIREITPWLLWGNMPGIELDYPGFDQTRETIQSIGNFLRNVAFVQADQKFIDLTRASYEALQTLRYPLQQQQLKIVLSGIQKGIDSTLLPHVLKQSNVDQLLLILENIVLCGSSMFCMSFVENCDPHQKEFDPKCLENALNQYYHDTREISAQCYTIVADMLFLSEADAQPPRWPFGDILVRNKSIQAELVPQNRFSVFINSTHCDVYGDIFLYLLSVWVANDSLKTFGIQAQKYKLVLNTLWAWFQQYVHETVSKLRVLFAGELVSLDSILASHTTILRDLGRKLLLSNQDATSSVKQLLLNTQALAQGEQVDDLDGPLLSLIACLDGLNEFTELMIALSMIS